MLLIGAGWQQVVSFLTAAQMIALAMGPPSLLALPATPRETALAVGRQHRPWPLLQPAGGDVVWPCGIAGAVLAIGVPSLIYASYCWRRGGH